MSWVVPAAIRQVYELSGDKLREFTKDWDANHRTHQHDAAALYNYGSVAAPTLNTAGDAIDRYSNEAATLKKNVASLQKDKDAATSAQQTALADAQKQEDEAKRAKAAAKKAQDEADRLASEHTSNVKDCGDRIKQLQDTIAAKGPAAVVADLSNLTNEIHQIKSILKNLPKGDKYDKLDGKLTAIIASLSSGGKHPDTKPDPEPEDVWEEDEFKPAGRLPETFLHLHRNKEDFPHAKFGKDEDENMPDAPPHVDITPEINDVKDRWLEQDKPFQYDGSGKLWYDWLVDMKTYVGANAKRFRSGGDVMLLFLNATKPSSKPRQLLTDIADDLFNPSTTYYSEYNAIETKYPDSHAQARYQEARWILSKMRPEFRSLEYENSLLKVIMAPQGTKRWSTWFSEVT